MTLRVGIIGCGGISHAHVRGWSAIPSKARVVAVADVSQPNAERVSAMVDGARIFGDYNDLLASGDVDAVDICLPHHLHKAAIVAAAGAGKNVMCEKPLCLTLAEADEIRQAVESSGVTFMSAHNQVFLPTVAAAKELLGDGLLGQIYKVYSSDCFVHPQTKLSDEEKKTVGRTWRSSKETMGGGELIDTGYHPTYRLLYLAGSEPVEVVAQTARFRLHHWEEEDTAEVMLRFAPADPHPESFEVLQQALGELETAPACTVEALGFRLLWQLVSILGFAPSVDACVIDGTPLPDSGSLPFSTRDGGALCASCAIQRGATHLPERDRADLVSLLDPAAPIPSLDARHGAAHRRLLARYIRYHLGEGASLPALEFWMERPWAAA